MKLKEILVFLLSLVTVGFFGTIWNDRGVTPEEIDENMRLLKKNCWFQKLLRNEKERDLIIHNKDVRYVIGSLNTDRLKRNSHKDHYRKKIRKVLDKKR